MLWSLVTSGNRISPQSPSSYVPTSNRHEALAVDKVNEQDSQGKTTPVAHTKICQRQWQALAMGDSAERCWGTHLPAWYTVKGSLLLARTQDQIWDVTERLPQLIKSTDCCPLLLFYVGISDMVNPSHGKMKQDFRALGAQVKREGAQMIFSSVLPVRGRGAGRSWHIMHTSTWLCGWCHCQGFGSLITGCSSMNTAYLRERGSTYREEAGESLLADWLLGEPCFKLANFGGRVQRCVLNICGYTEQKVIRAVTES